MFRNIKIRKMAWDIVSLKTFRFSSFGIVRVDVVSRPQGFEVSGEVLTVHSLHPELEARVRAAKRYTICPQPKNLLPQALNPEPPTP